jgi:hypothetical protein
MHLFAILLDPLVNKDYGPRAHALLACVVSIRPGVQYEDACVLEPGDHPFIKHPSYVDYRFTRFEPAEDVEARVAESVFVSKEDCSAELLLKIANGALRSKRISRGLKAILQQVIWGE